MVPLRCCSSVNETLKSELKSLPNADAQGNVQPIRALYACSFASGARDTAESMTSCFAIAVLRSWLRFGGCWSRDKLSAGRRDDGSYKCGGIQGLDGLADHGRGTRARGG